MFTTPRLSAASALALAVGICLSSAPAQAASPKIVAVFTVQAKGIKLAPERLERLSDYLASQIAASSRYRVVPRSQLKRRLKAQKRASYRACIDQSCQIEIGKELAAQQTLATEVIKLGSKCVVTSTLYDLRTAATERAATHKGGCGTDALVASLEHVSRKLTTGAKTTPSPTPPKPVGTTGTSGGPTERVTVDVRSEPSEAEVFVDGKSRGRTPIRLELPKGRSYTISAEKSGFQSEKKSFELEGRKTLSFRLTLTKAGQIAAGTRTEWFSVGGFLGAATGDDGGFTGGLTMSVVGLKWRYFYLQPLEAIVASPQSDGGFTLFVGASVGYPLFLGATGQHQLRFGLGFGLGNVRWTEATGVFKTTVEYTYQTMGRTFFGAGLNVLTPVTAGSRYTPSTATTSDSYDDIYALAVGLSLRIGWASKLD